MSTPVVKNIAAAVLVFGAAVVAVLVVGDGPTPNPSQPVAATSPTTAPSTVAGAPPPPVAPAGCPQGSIAMAVEGPTPAVAQAGYAWSPAIYPGTGWCEIKA